MSMTRNVLATVGAITIAVHAVKGYNKYLRKPVATLITDALDAERSRRDSEVPSQPAPPEA